MERGYFKVWRKIEDNRSWSRGLEYRGLMITLLEKANWKRGYFHGQEVLPGQLACSCSTLADEVGVTRYKLMRMLSTLEDDGFISRKTFNRLCTVINVVNWHLYQAIVEGSKHEAHTKRTSAAHEAHTIKEGYKAIKKIPSASADAAEENASPDGEERREETVVPAQAVQVPASPVASPSPEPAYRTESNRLLTGQALTWFNRVWDAFGYKRGKAEAADAFLDIEGLSDSLVEAICRAAGQEAAHRPDLIARGKTPKMLTGWLRGKRWEDATDTPPPAVPTAATGPLLGSPIIDMPTPAQREKVWAQSLDFIERLRRGEAPATPKGYDRRKPLPIPAAFRRVLQGAAL